MNLQIVRDIQVVFGLIMGILCLALGCYFTPLKRGTKWSFLFAHGMILACHISKQYRWRPLKNHPLALFSAYFTIMLCLVGFSATDSFAIVEAGIVSPR